MLCPAQLINYFGAVLRSEVILSRNIVGEIGVTTSHQVISCETGISCEGDAAVQIYRRDESGDA